MDPEKLELIHNTERGETILNDQLSYRYALQNVLQQELEVIIKGQQQVPVNSAGSRYGVFALVGILFAVAVSLLLA